MSETIRMVEVSDEMEMDIWCAAYNAMLALRDKVIVLLQNLRSDATRSDKYLEQSYRYMIRSTIADYRRAERALHWATSTKENALFDQVTKELV